MTSSVWVSRISATGENSVLLFVLHCMRKEPRNAFQRIVCYYVCGALQAGGHKGYFSPTKTGSTMRMEEYHTT